VGAVNIIWMYSLIHLCRLEESIMDARHRVLEHASGTAQEETDVSLEAIHAVSAHYQSLWPHLHRMGEDIAAQLDSLPDIRHISVHVLSEKQVLAKLMRIAAEGDASAIDKNRYVSYIDDFITVTCLLSEQKDWLPLHDFLNRTFLFSRQPRAVLRPDDPAWLGESFQHAGCEIARSYRAARGAEYYLENTMIKQPIQIIVRSRTVLEDLRESLYARVSDTACREPLLTYHLALLNELIDKTAQQTDFLLELERSFDASPSLSRDAASLSAAIDQFQQAVQAAEMSDATREKLVRKFQTIRHFASGNPELAAMLEQAAPRSFTTAAAAAAPAPAQRENRQEEELASTRILQKTGHSPSPHRIVCESGDGAAPESEDMKATIQIDSAAIRRKR
jgi:hypothetical protein